MGHIKEQLSDQVDVTNKTTLTDEEMSFYYFHLHDADNNTKLDGLEIMKAVKDAHEGMKQIGTKYTFLLRHRPILRQM